MPDEVKLLPCPWCPGEMRRFQMKTVEGEVVEMVEHQGWPHCCVRRDSMTVVQWNTRAIEATRPTIREVRDARQEAAQSFGGQEGDLHFELAKVLTIHWLTGLGCSHEGAGSNAALCWCGWTGPRVENVGQAVTCWVNHTLEEMRPQLVAAFERQGNG